MPSRIRSPSTSSASSGENQKAVETNGTKAVNGTTTATKESPENEAKDDAKKESESEDDEPCEAGMKTGHKNLYSGKEDKKGRYQWQDKIPEDLGVVAENDKTAKWALLVRNVKVYNDPTRVLAIHSIVVQSPLLKKLLAGVLKNYPGITTDLNRVEFSGKFEPLIHRWAELQAAIAQIGDETEEQRKTKEHAELLQSILSKEFKTLIDTSQDMKNKRVMTYEHLWTLFQPGSIIYARQDGQETAMQLQRTRYGADAKGNPVFWVMGKYIDWDGTRFGSNRMNLSISHYFGTQPITQLRTYPIEYHPDAQALKDRLIQRGAKVESLAGPNYKAYHGVGWHYNAFGSKEKYNIKSRVRVSPPPKSQEESY